MPQDPTSASDPREADFQRRFGGGSVARDGLRRASVRGGAATLLAQSGRLAIHVASLALLARVLSPRDFGLVAMVATVTNFALLFKDMGLAQAAVQAPRLDRNQAGNLFWINGALGLGLALLLCAAAPLVARFYDEPRLTGLVLGLAPALAMLGFAVQHQALLRRAMRLPAVAAIDLAAALAGALCAVGLALAGAGVWSLVGLQLGTAFCTMAGSWALCRWRPPRPARGRSLGRLLRFGASLSGFELVNYFSRNLDNILIGWRWGAAPLGLYSRAYSLLMLPLMQINAPLEGVVVPGLSRLQGEPERYRRYYLKALTALACLALPLAALLAVVAEELVALVLGPQWAEAAAIFRILSLAAFFHPVAASAGWLLRSRGRGRAMLGWGLASASVMAVAFALGLSGGPRGVAWAFLVATLLLIAPGFLVALAGTRIGPMDVIRAVLRPAVAALTAALAAAMLKARLPETADAWAAGALALGAMALAYPIAMAALGLRPGRLAALLAELKRQPADRGERR